MTLPAYPAKLPAPTVQGYQLTAGQRMKRTDVEKGAARQRLESNATPDQHRVTWIFTTAEFGAFEAWCMYYLHSGADWFTTNLANGNGIQNVEARIVNGSYQATPQPGLVWSVTATLEVRTLSRWSQAAFDAWNV